MNNFNKYKRFLTILVLFCFVLSAFIIPVANSKIYAVPYATLIRTPSIVEAVGVAVAGVSAMSVNAYSNIKGVVDDVYDKGTDILNGVKSAISSGVSNFADLFRSTRSDTYSFYEPTFGYRDYSFSDGFSMKDTFDWSSIGMPTKMIGYNIYFDHSLWESDQRIVARHQFTLNNGLVVNGYSYCKSQYGIDSDWRSFFSAYGEEVIDQFTDAFNPMVFEINHDMNINNYSYDEILSRSSIPDDEPLITYNGISHILDSRIPYKYNVQISGFYKGKDENGNYSYIREYTLRSGTSMSYIKNYPIDLLYQDTGFINDNKSSAVTDGTNTYTLEQAEAEGLASVKSVVGGTVDTYKEEDYVKKVNDVITLGSAGTGLLTGEGISEGIGDPTIDVLVNNGVISADGNIVPENLANVDELINTTTDQVIQQDLITFRDAYIRELELELEKALTTSVPTTPETTLPDNIFDPPTNRINFDPFKALELTTKFPFSLPWDIQYLINLFVSDPVTPEFGFTLPFSDLGVGFSDFTYSQNLDFLDSFIPYFHFFIVVSFTLSLVLLSFKFL